MISLNSDQNEITGENRADQALADSSDQAVTVTADQELSDNITWAQLKMGWQEYKQVAPSARALAKEAAKALAKAAGGSA